LGIKFKRDKEVVIIVGEQENGLFVHDSPAPGTRRQFFPKSNPSWYEGGKPHYQIRRIRGRKGQSLVANFSFLSNKGKGQIQAVALDAKFFSWRILPAIRMETSSDELFEIFDKGGPAAYLGKVASDFRTLNDLAKAGESNIPQGNQNQSNRVTIVLKGGTLFPNWKDFPLEITYSDGSLRNITTTVVTDGKGVAILNPQTSVSKITVKVPKVKTKSLVVVGGSPQKEPDGFKSQTYNVPENKVVNVDVWFY
jgi:hypothetical protein